MVWVLVIITNFFLALSIPFALGKNVPFQETLDELFPKCEQRKENIFLTQEQKDKIEKDTGLSLYSKMALRYHVTCKESTKTVYIDSHIVRTLNETVVVVIDEDNKIENFRISSFMEPSEYIPPQSWIKQVVNKRAFEKMRLNYEIDGLSGATLSTNAVVNASRRVLHLHDVLKKEQVSAKK